MQNHEYNILKMNVKVRGAYEHNLKHIDVEFKDGLTVVTGVSGSGKTSLVFDTLYHEARRRFLEVYTIGSAARLAPARVDEITGLGPAVAVGQNLLNRNPLSTLATASGLHPFLRLLYANFADRYCPACGAALSTGSKDGALRRAAELAQSSPFRLYVPLVQRAQGSHRSLLHYLGAEFGAKATQVDGKPWGGEPLDPSLPHDIWLRLFPEDNPGEDREKLTLPHLRLLIEQASALSASSLMVLTGVEPKLERLSWSKACLECGAPFVDLRPVHFHSSCRDCRGAGCEACAFTGLAPQAAAARWMGLRFPDVLGMTVEETSRLFAAANLPAAAGRLRTEIVRRLEALLRVGLGYLSLDRSSPSLSRGEAQRVRLALTLISRLTDMLHVLDEPTVGLHPADTQRLLSAFRTLPGPVVYVEHDRLAAAGADRVIDLGPGAGKDGGRVVFSGTPAELWKAETATGAYFSLRKHTNLPPSRPQQKDFLTIRGASLRNLREIDVQIPLGALTAVTGVSGSGKSTLVEDVLYASVTSGEPVGCREIVGKRLKPVMVDQSPIGRNPRSNPATYTKLADIIRDLFASAGGLTPAHFSFNRDAGACPTCGGLGAVEVSMRYLPSEWIECSDCSGQRFTDEVLSVRVDFGEQKLNIAEFYTLSVSEALPLIEQEQRLPPGGRSAALRVLHALEDTGLGYLPLGQASPTLSGGEAQRVKLARTLGQKSLTKELLVLDEPSTGLHPQDLAGLLAVLDRLVRAGATIVVVEHNLDIVRAADWVIDLGPGAGPEGGRLLYAGPVSGLADVEESLTGKALREEGGPGTKEGNGGPRTGDQGRMENGGQEGVINIQGARVHNLKNISVEIPKGRLTVVTGVSGSGKSSLVSEVLESEARRRFLETLSLYERQGTREGPEAEVDSISGLGVALTVGPERLVYSRRATVGSATEISHHLAALLSTRGEVEGGGPLPAARYFTPTTYAAACVRCNGVGSLVVPMPEKLIIHPEKPLIAGAMYSPGFFPNGYLGKPFNYGYYMLLGLARRYGFDPHETPWERMTKEAQNAFLYGTEEEVDVNILTRKGERRSYRARFPGFYGFIRDWDVGGIYTGTMPCPECGGKRLRPQYLAVKLGGYDAYELNQMTLRELERVISEQWEREPGSGDKGLETVLKKLRFLNQVGLGYLHLDRVAGTLSAGEAQRIRLAALLGSGLTSLTLLLDEPTRGLHPSEVEALTGALETLRDEGNTVIVVEHDTQVMRRADHLIDLGPGAGESGGRVTAQGSPMEVAQAETPTGRWLRAPYKPQAREKRKGNGWLTILGARANNLQGEPFRFPLGTLSGVCGVSGSGKSTLVIDTLGRTLAPKKQTTSVAHQPIDPGEHDSITGAPKRAVMVDQTRAGMASPAGFLGLVQPLRKLYAESEDAWALGTGEEQLSASCSACRGAGSTNLDMGFLPDVRVPCETCRGTGFQPEAWQVRLEGIPLPEVLGLTVELVYRLFGAEESLKRPLEAAIDVGLGYLVLRQPGYALSGGEAQRLKIASELLRKSSRDCLYILDEPTVGQHPEDVQRLIRVLHQLVDEGGSVLVVEHHPHLLAECDWLVELGPGGGPQGGRIIAAGTPEQIAQGETPTAPYLRKLFA